MSDQRTTESTPLLSRDVPSLSEDKGLARRATAFRIATMTSCVTSVLTVIFAITTVALVAAGPPDYYPPSELYYSAAPIAGFAIIAGLYSGSVLVDGAPLRGTITGILIDIFGGIYVLFQSLYIMQQFLGFPHYYYSGGRCRPFYGNPPPPPTDCKAWEKKVLPVFVIYLLIALVFGLAHVMLLILRASGYKPRTREIRVTLVGEDGNPIRR
ncbi:hypothetical protein GQ53DRAFT_832105 [Thozetella sp. PMI_491]|nr:hypothetical protein GQ53DRAFT_832105 [Thozetella sp. PMI_491]